MRRFSRRTFVSCLAALAARRTSVFKPQSAYAQQSAPPRRIGFLFVGLPREGNEVQQFWHGPTIAIAERPRPDHHGEERYEATTACCTRHDARHV